MRKDLLGIALWLVSSVTAVQTPFHAAEPPWNLGTPPSPDATGHLIFDTVSSMLQHWPNTRYRNGHNMVPGTMPVGTLLYHGRADAALPVGPEWVATDPEHAYAFCGAPREAGKGCWQLTLAAARPLKVLYFDGSSAANMQDGTLDMQDLLLWGKVSPERWLDERERIDGLCSWGREFGIDGFVRMEMDFELMLCDFKTGITLISADYLAAWWSRYITPPQLVRPAPGNDTAPAPGNDTEIAPGLRGFEVIKFETVHAGSWHNHYPGDARITLDLTRLVSFYDTRLAPSLVPQRAGRERWDHRLLGISDADTARVVRRLEAVLRADGRGSASASGVSWAALYHTIRNRYADRLELLAHLLNSTSDSETARKAQVQLRVLLTPYILQSARPPNASDTGASVGDDAWAVPVWRGCATKHMAPIHARQHALSDSEEALLRAADEVLREVCRVTVCMWAAGVRAGLDEILSVEAPASHPPETTTDTDTEEERVRGVARKWRVDLGNLMDWLDWSVWVKCRPACAFEEMCYLPTWPFFWMGPDGRTYPGGKTSPFSPRLFEGRADGGDEPWRRPQPRCVRRLEPYDKLY
ncbi:hypothetical protein B0H10DRAFT_2022650 [Mycena sp. CBHHK59/15]|nr:hypothetical protein B0H10DRAFT_2022650 [Mycena sp. CBHHK59/15]